MSDPLIFEKNGPVVTLTINRPESRNPLGAPEDADNFTAAAARINADRGVRCVILTGAGKAFSAGGNVKAMREGGDGFGGPGVHIRERYRNGIHRIVKSVWGIEVPVIAAVNGPAIGLGNDVACLADTRIAADSAIFGATFLKIGLIPGDGGAWLLPRIIGMARASELLYTGDTIDAATAKDWGLVSEVVPAAALMDRANEVAAKICNQPPDVLRMTKQLLRQGMLTSFDNVMELSASMQALAHHTKDHREALDAFFDKRPPSYKGE
ncbi:MAG: crotonase/enoyl-CoA hydratase family protein [Parvibaculum sp.]|uniref:crotonase/enoyl-CoA hydratase family protein n=1 Tax=Parvibaculum sp. TaxID=2024848 RepID=UPI001D8C8698|nr:crotonase/enoyl-CoA hydratase family protein [Parvibaculum sp.]MBX3490814.1 crotonase/enoyl-CoA hydratase family protein [Parvibaculum sp.]MBX3497373.1 crotonase/enoyl-CoA hydratase family protein [Parvibaculum sp.]MCW5728718.1 crotonase/enoyl-CoA hydratase family protein [Parvibaculum sp.]